MVVVMEVIMVGKLAMVQRGGRDGLQIHPVKVEKEPEGGVSVQEGGKDGLLTLLVVEALDMDLVGLVALVMLVG